MDVSEINSVFRRMSSAIEDGARVVMPLGRREALELARSYFQKTNPASASVGPEQWVVEAIMAATRGETVTRVPEAQGVAQRTPVAIITAGNDYSGYRVIHLNSHSNLQVGKYLYR